MAPIRTLSLLRHDLHHEPMRLAQREHMSMARLENLTAAVDNAPRIFGHLQERTDLLQAIEVLGGIRRRRLWRRMPLSPVHRASLDDLHNSRQNASKPGKSAVHANSATSPQVRMPRHSPHEALRANLSPFARYIEHEPEPPRKGPQIASISLHVAIGESSPSPTPSRHAPPQPKGAPA